jgi:hypothetical protein
MLKHGLVAATVLLSGCIGHGSAGPTTHDRREVPLDAAELTRVRLRMTSGELDVRGGAATLLEGDFAYNVPEWKPSISHSNNGSISDLEVSQGDGRTMFGDTENRWRLAVNDARPIELNARLGAGEARLTLGTLHLKRVELHMGAGEANVDLRGRPSESYRVEIHGGVGSATVRVPAAVGISATASGGIGSIDISGLEQRGDRWVNPHADGSPVTITLDVRGGIGEIKIVAE